MSNVSTILRNIGVGLNSIRTDEASLKKYIQQLLLLSAAFEGIQLPGKEICDKGFVIVHFDEIVYHLPANKENIIVYL